jgi:ABC-type uncharacterized transport system permease subunit
MELLGISTIFAYIISIFSIKYVIIEDDYPSYKKTSFDIIFFLSLVLFSAYTYSLIGSFYQKFNFATSLEITFLIVNYLFFAFMFSKPIKHLGLVLLPLTLITIPFSMIYGGDNNLGQIDNDLKIHVIVSITSYGFLGLAAIQAILLRYQENKLKHIQDSLFLTILPSIEKMEKVMFELIIFGFILLTLSLISGAPFIFGGEYSGLTEKILFSVIAWITYSYLIYSRFSKGSRGRKATSLTLSGMAFLFISYLGTKLFFEIF